MRLVCRQVRQHLSARMFTVLVCYGTGLFMGLWNGAVYCAMAWGCLLCYGTELFTVLWHGAVYCVITRGCLLCYATGCLLCLGTELFTVLGQGAVNDISSAIVHVTTCNDEWMVVGGVMGRGAPLHLKLVLAIASQEELRHQEPVNVPSLASHGRV